MMSAQGGGIGSTPKADAVRKLSKGRLHENADGGVKNQ